MHDIIYTHVEMISMNQLDLFFSCYKDSVIEC